MSSTAYDNNNTMNLNHDAIAHKPQEAKKSDEQARIIRKEKNKKKKKERRISYKYTRRCKKAEKKRRKAAYDREWDEKNQQSDDERRYPDSSSEEEEKGEEEKREEEEERKKFVKRREEEERREFEKRREKEEEERKEFEKKWIEAREIDKKKKQEKKQEKKKKKRNEKNKIEFEVRKDVADVFNECTNLNATAVLVISRYLESEKKNDEDHEQKMYEGIVTKITSLDIVHPKYKLVKYFVGFVDDHHLTSLDVGNVNLRGVSLINCPNLTRVYLPPFKKLEYLDIQDCGRLGLYSLGFVKYIKNANLSIRCFSFLHRVKKIDSLCIDFGDSYTDDLDLTPLLSIQIKSLLISGCYCRKIHILFKLMGNIQTVDIHENSYARGNCTPMHAILDDLSLTYKYMKGERKDMPHIRCACIPGYQRKYLREDGFRNRY